MSIKKPTGTNDFLPDDSEVWQFFQQRARDKFAEFGYKPIDTPIFEQTELFVRGIGEATDVVSKEMFAALSGENLKTIAAGGTIKNKSKLTLRPEGTAGVVRAALENGMVQQGTAPVKLMYAGPMFRAERPQQGRYRQFHQVGVECLGASSPTIDAEAIIALMRFFESIAIYKDDVTLLINSMGCEKCRPAYRNDVKKYIEAHAADMCDTCKTRAEINPLRAFDCKNETCAAVMKEAPRITDYLCDECASHHAKVLSCLKLADIDYVEDFTLVRGLDYYTRTVFEVQANTGGAQNAIGGGGRYDKLVAEIGGIDAPGMGFAIGYERCKLLLEAKKHRLSWCHDLFLFIVCARDAGAESGADGFANPEDILKDPQAATFKLVQECRRAGIPTDMDHQNRSVKSQFKLADKLNAEYVLTIGTTELSNKRVTVRDMRTHKEYDVELGNIIRFFTCAPRC